MRLPSRVTSIPAHASSGIAGTLTLRSWTGSRPRSRIARATTVAAAAASVKSSGAKSSWLIANAGQPESTASIAALTVPEYVMSSPRFAPWLMPLATRSIGPGSRPRKTSPTASDGEPSDAVGLVFLGLLPGPIDLVASGINHGANLGDDITYSGTVSAAMEAVLSGCPAFAISHDDFAPDDFTLAAAAATVVARAILERGLEPVQLLNVNVPAIPLEACAGIEVTRLGKRIYQDELIRRADPRGVPYYWVGGPPPTGQATPGTDVHALLHDRVSITPIQMDLTADRFLERLRGWELRLPD